DVPQTGFYEAFWKPLETALAQTERVYLSPDGVLTQVSLGIVPAGDGKLLMEKYDLRVVSSTRDILRAVPATPTNSAVLIGNPIFSLEEAGQRALARTLQRPGESAPLLAMVGSSLSRDHRGPGLAPLPGTRLELESVSTLLKKQQWKVEVDTEEKALEEVVKHVRSPRVLHIATHGFFRPDQKETRRTIPDDLPSGREDPMLRSGLYFAGANRVLSGVPPAPDLEDGVLTAYEAMGLNLQGTELVVLSACQTGLGVVKNGEGVFGLRRALQVAGAEAVLMSLWSVPDQETQELMTLFYERWLSGKGKHEALREAQLELRSRVKERRGHDLPFYWGAFVLVGR
ncbi:MAG: CHAT domain-containing protein, partial [Terriglobales bacterium]